MGLASVQEELSDERGDGPNWISLNVSIRLFLDFILLIYSDLSLSLNRVPAGGQQRYRPNLAPGSRYRSPSGANQDDLICRVVIVSDNQPLRLNTNCAQRTSCSFLISHLVQNTKECVKRARYRDKFSYRCSI